MISTPPDETVTPLVLAPEDISWTPPLSRMEALAEPPARMTSKPESVDERISPPPTTMAVSPGLRTSPLLTTPEPMIYVVIEQFPLSLFRHRFAPRRQDSSARRSVAGGGAARQCLY